MGKLYENEYTVNLKRKFSGNIITKDSNYEN